MATTATVGFSWMMLLLAGAAGAASFGGAPLELDPKLSAIAPEECLWYVAYSGQKSADPDSPNETEQLFAEPQVRKFIDELETQIMRAVRRASGPGREQRVLATEVPKLVKAALARPMAAYVEELKPRDGRRVDVEAALVFSAGDQRDAVETALSELLKLAEEKGLAVADGGEQGGVKWRRVQTPPDAPEVRFGWKDDYLIVAVGADTPENIVNRMNGSAPEWLTQLRDQLPVEREISAGYLNVAGILQRARPIVGRKHPGAWSAVEKLGLTEIEALQSVSGYDDKGAASLAQVVTGGGRPGVLRLLAHKPLKQGDLEAIPGDALVAIAARLDPAELWDDLVKLVVEFHPEARDKIERGLWEVEGHVGVNLREDLLEPLGDVWAAYLPGGDLFTSWVNSVAAVRVDDPAKLREAADKIADKVRVELARNHERATIVESTINTAAGELKVMTLQFEKPVPVAPSWCIADKWLIFALQPQAIQSMLDRSAEDSLAHADMVRHALEAESPPAVLVYQDTPQLVRSVYPFVQMGAQVVSGQLRRQGIEFNATSLPSVEKVVKHLRPSVSTMAHREDGFYFESLSSLPGGGSIGAAPMMAGLMLPALAGARQAARTSQESNNMRQLALAALMYHDAHNAFPTDVYDENGKALLSWRVQLLPYLEEAALYGEFRRDEPWDSEHNRRLLERMPPVFRSPSGDNAPGKTRFVALKGEGTIFRGQEPVRIRDITDGTSQTLLFVQAAPGHAVEWTRPVDIDNDPEKPFAGLDSPRNFFLGALCDGSVHRISLAISKEVMQALASRAGGEAVDYDVLSMPPGPHDYSNDVTTEKASAAPQ